jgi:kinesin family protein 5
MKVALTKPGRVKVGVRCRPAFQDEIDFAKGEFLSIVDTRDETKDHLGQISLLMVTGKQREFQYDYVFGPNASQDNVYERIARPVVTDVLKGLNGTIFAYGQTGTGKTYTMGILQFVDDEHAGMIPRAMDQIFHYVDTQPANVVVTLSFLQLYRETIQDLLVPGQVDDNLAIREDPQYGFYVEGLQEFVVKSYKEAGEGAAEEAFAYYSSC